MYYLFIYSQSEIPKIHRGGYRVRARLKNGIPFHIIVILICLITSLILLFMNKFVKKVKKMVVFEISISQSNTESLGGIQVKKNIVASKTI